MIVVSVPAETYFNDSIPNIEITSQLDIKVTIKRGIYTLLNATYIPVNGSVIIPGSDIGNLVYSYLTDPHSPYAFDLTIYENWRLDGGIVYDDIYNDTFSAKRYPILSTVLAPDSGLSAEYGDVILQSDYNDDSINVDLKYLGNTIVSENYKTDNDGKITIKNIAETAMFYFENKLFSVDNGIDGSTIPITLVATNGSSTIEKDITIYPCIVDFSGSLDVALLNNIPLSRSTNKTTAVGRKEWISFYGAALVKIYVVSTGNGSDVATTVDFATIVDTGVFYKLDVSPAVIASAIGCDETDLIYYNVYKSTDSIIRFTMDERNYPTPKTFVFRNCFGAQEAFTCVADENSNRKWDRSFGAIDKKQVVISRDMENRFTVSSGFVSDEDIEVLEDLLNSDRICLLDEYGFQDIVVVEENFSDNDRQDQLKEVSFTYRFAQDNQFKTSYKAFRKPRVFTEQFDETFN